MKTILTPSEIDQVYMVLTDVDRSYMRHKLAEAARSGKVSVEELIYISPRRIRDYLEEVGIHQFNQGSLSPLKGEGLKLYEKGGSWHFSYFERGGETVLSTHDSMESAIESRIDCVKLELFSIIK